MTPAVTACLSQYKTPNNFLQLYGPKNQYAYCKDIKRAYMGTAPSLGVISKAFGDNVTKAWLSLQLIDLSEFSGCRDKLTTFQIASISEVIMATWGYMKVTELMHFFLQFKAGKYGKFYGAVDGLVITEALQEFARDRYEMICRYEREEEQRAKSEEDERHKLEVQEFRAFLKRCRLTVECWYDLKQQGLSDAECEEIGWLFNMGYEPRHMFTDQSKKPNLFQRIKSIFK